MKKKSTTTKQTKTEAREKTVRDGMNREFDPRKIRGLTGAEVAEKLKIEGYNELPSAGPKTIFAIAFSVIKEPMFILLVLCGGLYLVLGDIGEAAMLLGFVFIIMGITFYQERKTERALEALRDLSSPRASVIRDGKQIRIPGRDVVSGDIIVLSEGDRVPADAEVMYCVNLTIDESLLTGESVPVRKTAVDGNPVENRPGGDDLPYVYSGTLIVSGSGYAMVTAAGGGTEIGKIGKALKEVKEETTLLKKQTGRLVKTLALVGMLLCLLVITAYGLLRFSVSDPFQSWMNGVLSGITLAMAMLPEEFPVVLTIFMAAGAWRISKRNVLTRRVAVVETLGSATVLCSDKTGTLTHNRMTVQQLYADGDFFDVDYGRHVELPETFHSLVEYGILASQKDPFDPMEKAITDLGTYKLSDTEHLHFDWKLIRQYPLSRELLAMSHVWESPDGKEYTISAKGAPEAIFDLCHLPGEEQNRLEEVIRQMAGKGLRLLGVAASSFRITGLPVIQHDFDFTFLGFIGLADPVRETVPLAIQECYRAGIKVVMITGDYSETAVNIAGQIGLKNPEKCITGAEIDRLTDDELRERVKETGIFARVVPEHKLKIVAAFKANGEVVAMTGDGVNDAPALKSAHIGIAMGERGTDVARESSGLVLTDDDFSSIVSAVRMGRRIFDNLQKAMTYILSVHIPIAGLSLIPVFFRDLPLIFWPVHIVFLELIIDPACSVVFEMEKEEENIMHRPPRNLKEPLFGLKKIMISVLQGLIVLFTLLAVYVVALFLGKEPGQVRALTFAALIVANLGLILTNRSLTHSVFRTIRSRNMALVWVVAGALVFLVLVLFMPVLNTLFHFGSISIPELLICMGIGLSSIFWFEVFKIVTYLRRKKSL
ncbi:MAG: cation-translocating P-type ATPase [Spirochaetales bacterium]|nr:cation-translocating P-type ATPase [Spirochaetales bacterium]